MAPHRAPARARQCANCAPRSTRSRAERHGRSAAPATASRAAARCDLRPPVRRTPTALRDKSRGAVEGAPIKDRRLQCRMSLLVKICGLSTPEALDAALDAGADMVGFVFFPPSPRHLGFEARARARRARARAARRRSRCRSTPTTRCSPRVVEALQPDMLQLHGKRDAGARRRGAARASACR